jgi:hypothetical protein
MKRKLSNSEANVLLAITVLSGASFAYIGLVHNSLEQTSALFIGIPAIIVIGLSFLPSGQSITAYIVKGTLLALGLSAIIFNEGLICILMSTPIFLGVAVAFGRLVEAIGSRSRARFYGLAILLPLSLEGVIDPLTFDREEKVVVKEIVRFSPEEIKTKLTKPPDFSKTLPLFLKLGFPVPVGSYGTSLEPGAIRCTQFKNNTFELGELCLKVIQNLPNLVSFRAIKDSSKISHWLTWQGSIVSWEKINEKKSQVTWTFNYTRELDPAWYFGPLERFTVALAGKYLLKAHFGQGG